jgi:polyhydroxyalkanoate synthesis regulator phasin
MPRVRSQVVAMLEHLHQLREEIHSLTNNLKDVRSPIFLSSNRIDHPAKMEASEHISGSQSPKSLVVKEERRIQDLQARISQLRKRVRSLKPVRLCL